MYYAGPRAESDLSVLVRTLRSDGDALRAKLRDATHEWSERDLIIRNLETRVGKLDFTLGIHYCVVQFCSLLSPKEGLGKHGRCLRGQERARLRVSRGCVWWRWSVPRWNSSYRCLDLELGFNFYSDECPPRTKRTQHKKKKFKPCRNCRRGHPPQPWAVGSFVVANPAVACVFRKNDAVTILVTWVFQASTCCVWKLWMCSLNNSFHHICLVNWGFKASSFARHHFGHTRF